MREDLAHAHLHALHALHQPLLGGDVNDSCCVMLVKQYILFGDIHMIFIRYSSICNYTYRIIFIYWISYGDSVYIYILITVYIYI